ncbi:MAG: hypothetical protein ABI324_02695 [Ktedonobacteraceae bacterium]
MQNNLTFLKHPNASREQQRMTLAEFRTFIHRYLDAVIAIQEALDEAKPVFRSSPHQYTTIIRSIIRLGEYFDNFHDDIEFSMFLPLCVVPFLLPLTTLLRKASSRTMRIKTLFQGTPLPLLRSSVYEQIKDELAELGRLCDEVQIQTRQLLTRAAECEELYTANNPSPYNVSRRQKVRSTGPAKIIQFSDFLSSTS